MGILGRSKTFVLRLPTSSREQATASSKADGISLNHFISLAVAEKLSRLESKASEARNDKPYRPAA
jgi:hypothetical protein